MLTKYRCGFENVKMFSDCLKNTRAVKPLVHCITNYVTVNDVANAILACGASPVMSDAIEEVEDIEKISDALVVNIGTLNSGTVNAMFAAAKFAEKKGIPIVLDPVGAGASKFRTSTAKRLLQQIRFTALKGNSSEIEALFNDGLNTRGVDASESDSIKGTNLTKKIEFIKQQAEKYDIIICATGEIDIVSSRSKSYVLKNGTRQMSRVSGTGCQVAGIAAAYLASNPQTPLEAVAAAISTMSVAGEIALVNMGRSDGNATYRNRIIDAISNMDSQILDKRLKYEIF